MFLSLWQERSNAAHFSKPLAPNAAAAVGCRVLPHPLTTASQRQPALALLADALLSAAQGENASIPSAQSSPSPVASHRAHAGPSSRTACASYSATSAGVSVSAQRPFT